MKTLLTIVYLFTLTQFAHAQALPLPPGSASIKTIDFSKLNKLFLPPGLRINFYPGTDYVIVHEEESVSATARQVNKPNENYQPYNNAPAGKIAGNTDEPIAIIASPYMFYLYYGDIENIR